MASAFQRIFRPVRRREVGHEHGLGQLGGEAVEAAEGRRTAAAGGEPFLVMALARSAGLRTSGRFEVAKPIPRQQGPIAAGPLHGRERSFRAHDDRAVGGKLAAADQLRRRFLSPIVPIQRDRPAATAGWKFELEPGPGRKGLGLEPRCLRGSPPRPAGRAGARQTAWPRCGCPCLRRRRCRSPSIPAR